MPATAGVTVWVSGAVVLLLELASPPYTAVIAWLPPTKPLAVYVAVPLLS